MIIDSVPLLVECKRDDSLYKILQNRNIYKILWSRHKHENKNLCVPLTTFQHSIYGHINGLKTMKELRASLQNAGKPPSILSLPFILLDDDSKSVNSGGFDFAISPTSLKIGRFSDVILSSEVLKHELDKCVSIWNGKCLDKNVSLGNKVSSKKRRTDYWDD